MHRPHWRKMTWLVVVWCVVILLWAISVGASSSSQSVQDCVNQGFLSAQACQNAANADAGIGVALILFIGFVGFVFLSLIWLMSRPRTRACPVCGNDVKRGNTSCPSCNYDFRAAASQPAAG